MMKQYEQRFNLEILGLKNLAEARGRRDEYRYDSLRNNGILKKGEKMKKIKSLKGKSVAIVGMGKSWFDYNLSKITRNSL